ncbi:MAG: ribosome small subunit-dependent GTPase A [Verrucomicrobia bacterium]|nr:ribosome small subunit-dependent GTPase A [Verrucomicrobiota bacterium]
MNLSSLGWDDAFAHHFQPYSTSDFAPARVALGYGSSCTLYSALGELTGACTGRLQFDAGSPTDLPVVGDWVVVRPRPGETVADIHAVLPRRSAFVRRAAGRTEVAQIIAANVDTVFLVSALDGDFKLRRIERYLAAARESGAQAVVLLNKADLASDPADVTAAVREIAAGAPVVTLSAACDADPAAALAPWLAPGQTVALLGSSGVGKSTLVNRLLGSDHQRTAGVSGERDQGRHTTTRRELLLLPSGTLVIDTPGLRELQFWDVTAPMLDETFADIAALATRCRFGDCAHRDEPGCAVQAALDAGELDAARWQSYLKLQRERAHAARKSDPRLARANRAVWRRIAKGQRARYREENPD